MNKDKNIVIAGAGSIGCFIGGLLQHSGQNVTFLGRQRMADQITSNGLAITDFSGLDVSIPADQLNFQTEPACLSNADIILVCVKSGATEEMADTITRHATNGAAIVSLQNGVQNSDLLKKKLTGMDVRAGMVPFNVVQMGEGRFHRGTSGHLIVEGGTPDIASLLNVPNLEVKSSSNMKSVQWGKLLINLNNAINAISGIPLLEQLSKPEWRKRMADQMSEGLKVLKAEGIKPAPPAPVPAWLMPHILRLPTPLFRMVAKQMMAIDPQARSSMWEDIQQGRKTEIDELQGEIIMLGKKHNIPTPINEEIMSAIKTMEEKG